MDGIDPRPILGDIAALETATAALVAPPSNHSSKRRLTR
jgi:hypothetical protein